MKMGGAIQSYHPVAGLGGKFRLFALPSPFKPMSASAEAVNGWKGRHPTGTMAIWSGIQRESAAEPIRSAGVSPETT